VQIHLPLARCHLASETLSAYFFIDADKRHTFQEVMEALLAFLRIAGVIHTFPQFSERDSRESEAQFRHAFLNRSWPCSQ